LNVNVIRIPLDFWHTPDMRPKKKLTNMMPPPFVQIKLHPCGYGYMQHSLPATLAAFSPALRSACAPKGKTQRPNKMVKKQTECQQLLLPKYNPAATCYYFMPLQRNSIAFFAFNKVCVYVRTCLSLCVCV